MYKVSDFFKAVYLWISCNAQRDRRRGSTGVNKRNRHSRKQTKGEHWTVNTELWTLCITFSSCMMSITLRLCAFFLKSSLIIQSDVHMRLSKCTYHHLWVMIFCARCKYFAASRTALLWKGFIHTNERSRFNIRVKLQIVTWKYSLKNSVAKLHFSNNLCICQTQMKIKTKATESSLNNAKHRKMFIYIYIENNYLRKSLLSYRFHEYIIIYDK